MSKMPLKFQEMPLTLVFDLHFHTDIKLNMTRDGKNYLISQDELTKPEYHQLRFEGLVKKYPTNDMSEVVKMRNMYRRQAKRLSEGLMPEVEEWTITNIDRRVEYND